LQAVPGTDSRTHYEINSAAAKDKHKAILWPILLGQKPFSYVNDPGTVLQVRLLDPSYRLCSSAFYRDKLGKIYININDASQ
jgi:hypothetical protein